MLKNIVKNLALSLYDIGIKCLSVQVVVAGHHIRSNMSEAFQALGYCPQHDALWETIKLSEHLELYAAIKGIPKNEVPMIVK